MIRRIAMVIGLLLLLLLGRAALSSGEVAAESARLIEAPPKTVMPYLDNFHGWAGWWPPERGDPGVARRFGATASGPGARYDWTTGGQAGSGSMTIVAQTADTLTIRVDQRAPQRATADIVFKLTAVDEGTRVTMRYAGHQDFWQRLRQPLGPSRAALETRLDDALTYLKMAVEGTEPA